MLSDKNIAEKDYVISVVPKEAVVVRKISAKEDIRSRYQSGTRTLPNPDYARAQANVYGAENAATRQQINASRPTRGWGAAILQGLASGIAEANRQKAYQDLNSISPTIDEPVYEDYQYSVSHVELTKTTSLNMVVFDVANNSAFVLPQAITEKKVFKIAFNVHDKDPDAYSIRSKYESEQVLEAFEKQAATIQWSEVMQAAVKGDRNFSKVSDRSSFVAALLPSKATALSVSETAPISVERDPRFTSVVVVISGSGSLGTGFYVEPNVVMTNYHVVEGSNLAEIKLANGKEVLGKVIRADPGRDLALIRVQEAGVPLRFFDGSLRQGATVDVLGHPRGMGFSLSRGVVSAVRKSENPYAKGGAPVTYVQTDASINPGNSGGPMMIDDRVVGINTLKRRAAEGVGFAVHYSEAVKFLKEQ